MKLQLNSALVGFSLLIPFSFVHADTLGASTPYQVCFTPGGNCTQLIVNTINGASKSIDVQAYGFTSAPIVKALLRAQKRGVQVKAILDKSNAYRSYSGINTLMNNHIPVLIDSKVAIAHNKVMIIDDKAVITGSFNFTKSAQTKNAENVLILSNTKLAQSYQNNFHSRWSVSLTPSQYCMSSTKCKISSLTNNAASYVSEKSKAAYNGTKKFFHKHF